MKKNRIPLEQGKYYHIYHRGNNRENIFVEKRNYHYFFKLYTKYIVPIADTYAYCLLKNHFHILVRIKETSEISEDSHILLSNPSRQFSNFFNSYAKSFNKTYKRTGSLFEGRFGRIRVDSEEYLSHLILYIHFNPQKHGFVKDFRTYPYSSYRVVSLQKVTQIETGKVLDWFGGHDIFNQCHHSCIIDEKQICHLIGDVE